MAKTHLQKLGERVLVASTYHNDPKVQQRRLERLPVLMSEWLSWSDRSECPRCNAVDVALSEQPIAFRAGLVDRAECICALCIVEVKSERLGLSPVYTKR